METIRKGYKHTDIGIIPEDWEVVQLSNVSNIINGDRGVNYPKSNEIVSMGVPFINAGHLKNGKVNFSEMDYISKEKYSFMGGAKIELNDILVCLRGSLGKFAFVNFCEGALASSLCLVRCNQILIQPLLLSQLFSHNTFINFIGEANNGSSQPNLSATSLKEFRFALSKNTNEQLAIAEVLSDIDSLIEVLDKKIAKKRAIKDGAMQQLLTAKKRLLGFSDPWVEKKLGDISNIRTGSRNGEESIIDGAYPFFVRSQIVQRINSYSFDGEAILVPGEGGIGEIFHYINGRFDYHQRVYKISNFEDNIDCKFVFYYLKRYFGNYALQQTVKATVDSLRLPTFTDFEIRLPKSKKEQQAISEILTNMDAEIELLEQQRSKYTALKQGAMQQLLTGQIRLVADRQIRQTDKSSKQANVHFKRSVWAAEIVDRLCNEPTFGHVKMEKMIFLTEHLCGVEIGSNYHRDAAGPYDNRAIRSIDSQLKKQNWFEAKREERAIRYIPLSKRGGHKDYFNKYFSDIQADFDKVINTFRNWNTEHCEIVATLFSAWKDIVLAQKSYSDEDIINEVLNNWHESKKRIPIERWQLALNWMREKGFEPKL